MPHEEQSFSKTSVLLVWEDFYRHAALLFSSPRPVFRTQAERRASENIALNRSEDLPACAGKGRHRRLDYHTAQTGGTVRDAKRGEADSLTVTSGCATHPRHNMEVQHEK